MAKYLGNKTDVTEFMMMREKDLKLVCSIISIVIILAIAPTTDLVTAMASLAS